MPKTLEERVGQALRLRGWSVALGESCTGGLVGHRITEVAGSSEYLAGGIIAYSNEAKQALLGVSQETLLAHGAVSPETAQAMAEGARAALGADVGLSVTGIAGPGGGTEDKPVGLTYIGLSGPFGNRVERYVWTGDRVANKEASARAALELLLNALENES